MGCVCVCVRTRLCVMASCVMLNTLIGRDKEGVTTCLPDGGVTGSEVTSFCGVLMNAGTSCGDKIAVRLGRQAGKEMHLNPSPAVEE